MKYLLDTHTALWLLADQKKLSKRTRSILENLDNPCYVSIASLWEISIKYSLGKLELQLSVNELEDALEENEIYILPIRGQHIHRISRLKFHHRDPFDRMIIAQAMEENLSIISMDGHFEKYKVRVIW
jgi:PIN domain nuclease of toxin-antitoxin system